MVHYLYKISNLKTGEYYLGVRSTSKSPNEDSYMGSSSLWTKTYIKEHKLELIKEVIDCSFSTRYLANLAEKELILKHIDDPLCINLSIPNENCTQYGKECPEWKKKLFSIKFTGKNNPFYGRHHSEETKQSIRESIGDSRVGKKNSFYGKHHTEESNNLNRIKHTGINNSVSKPVKYTNLDTNEVLYFGSLNLCMKHIKGSYAPLKKQVLKGRPYKKIHFVEYITKDEFLLHSLD